MQLTGFNLNQLVFNMTPTIGSLALLLLNSLFSTTLLFFRFNWNRQPFTSCKQKRGRIQPRMGIVHVQKIGALTMSLWLFCKCKRSTIFVDLEEKKPLCMPVLCIHIIVFLLIIPQITKYDNILGLYTSVQEIGMTATSKQDINNQVALHSVVCFGFPEIFKLYVSEIF